MDLDHAHGPAAALRPPQHLDYSLVGEEASRAIECGLAEADWYQCPVPRATLRGLLERKDGPAIRDTIVLLLILVGTGWATAALWGTWWAVLPYLVYATFYGTASDSRWHECGHGTAFKSDWMNRLVYEIASFMVMRESVVWRWSHTRHHSDTIIVGRDPEIQVPRPPDMKAHVLSLFNVGGYRSFFPKLLLHATDGICTHGNNHLADGLVIAGTIECPKHNGRFRLSDGSPARAPVCRGLAVYPLEERAGRLWLNIARAGGCGARQPKTLRFNIQIACDEF